MSKSLCLLSGLIFLVGVSTIYAQEKKAQEKKELWETYDFLMGQGESLIYRQKFPEAFRTYVEVYAHVARYEPLLHLTPRDLDTIYANIIYAAVWARMFKETHRWLEEGIQWASKNKESKRTRISIAYVYGVRRQFDLAQQEIEKITKENPDDQEAFLRKAEIYSWNKQYEKSREAYKRCQELNPTDPLFRLRYSEILLAQYREEKNPAHLEEAISNLEKMLLDDPWSDFTLKTMAEACSHLQKEAMEKLLGDLKPILSSEKLASLRAHVFVINSQFKESANVLQQMLSNQSLYSVLPIPPNWSFTIDLVKKIPGAEDAIPREIEKNNKWEIVDRGNRQIYLVVKKSNELHIYQQGYGRLLLQLAYVLQLDKRYSLAEQKYREAIELHADKSLHLKLAELFLWQRGETKNPKYARKAIIELLKCEESNERNILLAQAYSHLVRFDEALLIDKENRTIREIVAYERSLQGYLEKAVEMYKEFLQEEGIPPEEKSYYFYRLGDLLKRLYLFPEARVMYEKSAEISPDNSDIFIGLAELASWQRKDREAKKYYEMALKKSKQYYAGNISGDKREEEPSFLENLGHRLRSRGYLANSTPRIEKGNQAHKWQIEDTAHKRIYTIVRTENGADIYEHKNANAWIGLGEIAAWEKDYQTALEYYRLTVDSERTYLFSIAMKPSYVDRSPFLKDREIFVPFDANLKIDVVNQEVFLADSQGNRHLVTSGDVHYDFYTRRNTRAFVGIGNIHAYQGDYSTARKYYEAAMFLDTRQYKFDLEIVREQDLQSGMTQNLCQELRQKGIEVSDDIEIKTQNQNWVVEDRIKKHRYLLVKDGESLSVFDCQNPEALLGMGNLCAWQRDYENSIAYYRAALKVAPGFNEAKLAIANVERYRCHWKEARKEYEGIKTSYAHDKRLWEGLYIVDQNESHSIGGRFQISEDSIKFKTISCGGGGKINFSDRFSGRVDLSYFSYENESVKEVTRSDCSISLEYTHDDFLQLEVGYRASIFGGNTSDSGTLHGWFLSMRVSPFQHLDIFASCARIPFSEGIATIREDYYADTLGAGIDIRLFHPIWIQATIQQSWIRGTILEENYDSTPPTIIEKYTDDSQGLRGEIQCLYQLYENLHIAPGRYKWLPTFSSAKYPFLPNVYAGYKYRFLGYGNTKDVSYFAPNHLQHHFWVLRMDYEILEARDKVVWPFEQLRWQIEARLIHLSEDSGLGYGISGNFKSRINNRVEIDISASYEDIPTDERWDGWVFQGGVTLSL